MANKSIVANRPRERHVVLSPDDLTTDQKALLVHLANFGLRRKIGPMLVPIPNGPMDYIIYVYGEGSFPIRRLSDLDALCGAGCIDFRLNRMGTAKVYLLTEISYKTADLWRSLEIDKNIETDLGQLSGGETSAKEILYQRWGELQQRLPAHLPADIRQRLFSVMDECGSAVPNKSRISFQLRRIGRHLMNGLTDIQSARLLQAYSSWVRGIYDRLENGRRV